MTQVATAQPTTRSGDSPAATAAGEVVPTRSGPQRRWHRLAIPFGILALIWGLTGFSHVFQQTNPTDEGTLSPLGTGRHGSSELADRLTSAGVSITQVTSTAEAVSAAAGADATIFVPTPNFLRADFLERVLRPTRHHRIVFVRPAYVEPPDLGTWVYVDQTRWTTGQAKPGCRADYAVAAGNAVINRDIYTYNRQTATYVPTVCYGGSLLSFTDSGHEIVVVGASEPFRNDRFHEAGNATLATQLLSANKRVIWVDVHRPEVDVVIPPLPEYRRGERDRNSGTDTFYGAFPPQFWAALLLLLAAAVLFALVRARRLGPPVAEPLPVLVPAAETVTGRGRLYQRIRARGPSLQTLRDAAIGRLARALAPLSRAPERALNEPGPAREAFLAEVAARARTSPEFSRRVLYGPPPEGDDELIARSIELDNLVAAVLREHPQVASTQAPAQVWTGEQPQPYRQNPTPANREDHSRTDQFPPQPGGAR